MNKRPVYLFLGSSGSGRLEVLSDLLADGLAAGEKAAVLVTADDPERATGDKLTLVDWVWTEEKRIEAEDTEGADILFFVTDGRKNPVDQIEAFQAWIKREGLELARVFSVVDCQLAERKPELLPWFDACIHFSDVVLLNRREGVANKWVSDFISRYTDQCYPCLFELVKAGKVKNPAMLLEPQAMRISQIFDEEVSLDFGDIEFGESEEDEEGEELSDEEKEDIAPAPDPYLQRRLGGRRVREIPDIADYLG